MRARARRLLGAAALGTLTFAAAARAHAQQPPMRAALPGKLTQCRTGSVDGPVLCGNYEVPENRAVPGGRKVTLNLLVLPATTDSVLDDPVFFLAGGGVVPATRYARFLSTALPGLRRRRDIVLVDQRGTGGSNALTCDRALLDTASGVPPDERYLRYIAACRESLASRADARYYTTTVAMQDLDDVRAWLAYPRVNLYGASYGTSAAATYIRLFPDRVRAVVMHGVVPLDVSMQVELARSAQQSLDRVLSLCDAESACRAAFPELRTDLARVLAGAGPPVREALNAGLASVPGIRTVPMLIHEAALGVIAPDANGPRPGGPEPAPLGVRLSILCSEGLANLDTVSIGRMTARTFLGESVVRFQMHWCDGWPTLPLPADFRSPFRSATPALLLTGDLDPITPPAYADHVATWFERVRVVRLPNRSHSDTDPCVTRLIERFIIAADATVTEACLSSVPPIGFQTSR
ncbi:MAG TPA: alpha/beta hydrolase [Gemmatimonadaceae bacterium]|nr:alpha/beta hydrolase [Gemmatimonadaceae bacterium]